MIMPISKQFKPMLESLKKKYTDGKNICYELNDGNKFCMNEKAWEVFYGMMKKREADDTKPLSQDNLEISDLENIEEAIKLLNEEIDKDFSYGIQVQKLSNKTIIRGVLLAEGVWKGVPYSYEKIKESAMQFLSNEEIMVNGTKYVPSKGDVDHRRTSKYKDKTVASLTKVIPNDMLKCLMFEAEVTDKDAIEDIANGSLNAVSPTGRFTIDGSYQPLGWALTGSPACHFSTIFNYDLSMLDENTILDTTEDNLNNSADIVHIENNGDIIMSETKVESKPVEQSVAESKEDKTVETKQVETKKEEPKTVEVKTVEKIIEKQPIVQSVDVEKIVNDVTSQLFEKLKPKEEVKEVKEEPAKETVKEEKAESKETQEVVEKVKEQEYLPAEKLKFKDTKSALKALSGFLCGDKTVRKDYLKE